MGTASSKAKVAAAAPLQAQGVQPKPATGLGPDSAHADSKVAPMPSDGTMAGAMASPLTTPGGRPKRRRMVSIQNDAELVGALKALSEIEDSLREKGLAKTHGARLETLREFLTSKALRNMVLQRTEMTKLKNQYRALRRASDEGRELATYVEQFGVPGEERGRRRSVTLGQAILAGRVAKRLKSNIMEVAKAARTTESLVVRVCGLGAAELEELATAQADLNRWGFDVLKFNELVKGNALMAVGILLFGMHELPKSVAINQGTLCGFLQAIQSGYQVEHPYHNAIHAADVMQTTNVFLVSHLIESLNLRPLEVFSMLVAAAIHDFRHPGVNNNFLIKTSAPLAIVYNDASVLENMHCAEAFKLCRADQRRNIFKDMAKDSSEAARKLIIAAVLGTDMAHHFQKLTEFNASVVVEAEAGARRGSTRADNGEAPVEVLALEPDQRQLALCVALHAADVSNPVKPLEVYKRWAFRVMDEFFNQGDKEVAAGIGISPFMDRHQPQAVKCQTGFINFIVQPLFTSFQALVPSLRESIEGNLARNRAWLAEPECFQDLPLAPDAQRWCDVNRSGNVDVGAGGHPLEGVTSAAATSAAATSAAATSGRASEPVMGVVDPQVDHDVDDEDQLPAASFTTPRPVFSAPSGMMTVAGAD